MKKGFLALDIDGTLCTDHLVPTPTLIHFLTSLSNQGWVISFITGRSFPCSMKALSVFQFPYYLACHHGALIVSMPALKKQLSKDNIFQKNFSHTSNNSANHPTDWIVYTDMDDTNHFYLSLDRFSPKMREYLDKRWNTFREKGTHIDQLFYFPSETFASVELIGEPNFTKELSKKMKEKHPLYTVICKDPYDLSYSLLKVTHPIATKGISLKTLTAHENIEGPIIAAGDDYNDQDMLEAAPIAIAMETAPPPLKENATFISSSSEKGLIQTIEKAIQCQ